MKRVYPYGYLRVKEKLVTSFVQLARIKVLIYYKSMTLKTIIDSIMTKEEALAQNPEKVAPASVLENLAYEKVSYFGFDNLEREGHIVMHKDAMSDVLRFFEKAKKLHFPIQKVIPIAHPNYKWDDNLSCDDNNSSGYNFRFIAGTTRMSKHAEGLAFDINPMQNPYIKYDESVTELWRAPEKSVYDENAPGTLTTSHPLVLFMKSLGWEWGGDWKKEQGPVDYQHFEKSLA